MINGEPGINRKRKTDDDQKDSPGSAFKYLGNNDIKEYVKDNHIINGSPPG